MEPGLTEAVPLLTNRSQAAASIQSVLTQLHAIQQERMNIMEQEERDKVGRCRGRSYTVPLAFLYMQKLRNENNNLFPKIKLLEPFF